MRSTFANGRGQLPPPTVTVTSGGTTTVARSLYFTLQGENPAGLNLPSTVVGPISVAVGQQVQITIPATSLNPGEWWTSFVVGASTSSDLTTFTQIAKLPGYTLGGNLTSLPATITLSTDNQLALSAVVANPASLPTDAVAGTTRGVISNSQGNALNYIYEYNPTSSLTVDNLTVLGVAVGQWLRVGSFSTNVAYTTDPGGCAQDIRTITQSAVQIPRYACNGSAGTAMRFWIQNDELSPQPQGKRVGLVVQFNGEDKSQAFNGLLRVNFRGYAGVTDGSLRTTDSGGLPLAGLNTETLYQSQKTNLVLPDDLQPNEAYALDVYPDFTAADLENQVPTGAVIAVYPLLYLQSGEYSEAGIVIGDCIYNTDSLGLVLPAMGLGVNVLARSGMVDSFSFLSVGISAIAGLVANTAGQIIAIDGNGTVSAATTLPLPQTQAQRAIVSTLDGVGNKSAFSGVVAIAASSALSVTCPYPCTSSGVGTIRADYPDSRIAGNSSASFNPTYVTLYVKRASDGQIRAFSGLTVVPGTSQTFTLTSWASGTVITSVPTPADSTFGLFATVAPTLATGTGTSDFTADSYSVAAAFGYNNAITGINHSEALGCIVTNTKTLTQLLQLHGFNPKGAWLSTVAYGVDDLVSYSGSSWRAIAPSTNVTPVEGPGWTILAASGRGFTPQGPWNATTAYNTDDTVSYSGSSWRSLVPNSGITPSEGATWTLVASVGAPGRGFTPRGAWSASTTYVVDDTVSYGGSSWRALVPNSGIAPNESFTWTLAAASGTTGPSGAQGVQGVQGRGFTPRGPWSVSTAYNTDDTVSYGGSSWRALIPNNGVTPSESATWTLVATGTAGPSGAQGATGPQGPQGSTVVENYITVTASNLGAGATTTLAVTVAKAALIVGISTTAAARVRGYQSAAAASADLNRAFGTNAAKAAGLIFDLTTGSGSNSNGQSVVNQLAWNFNPVPIAINTESPRTSIIQLTITNNGSTAQNLGVTLDCEILAP